MKNKTTGAAIFTLIKDAIIIAITFGIISAGFGVEAYGSTMNKVVMAMVLGGIPFGWRWASKIITAISIQGILIKLVISFFLGWLAVWVVVGKDIIALIAALADSRKRVKVSTRTNEHVTER